MFSIALSLPILFFLSSAVAFIHNPPSNSHSYSRTPVMKFINTPPDSLDAYSSKPLKLDVCLATTTVVQCEWLRDGELISFSAEAADANLKRDIFFTSAIICSNLTIKCLQDGLYTFRCHNGIDTIETHTIVKADVHAQLDCRRHESLRVFTYSDFVMAKIGQSAVLFCESNKIGSWEWTNNGYPINSDDKYVVSSGTLIIQNLRFDDKDDYHCSVLTEDGVDSRNLTLLTVG
ncbi:hypothetical protein CAEBREN_03160 [Caenorhabditis brenneri]|uniref:Ig-like domain-containing protein n=1 Tax=Caenorhabditis brenneri TaxID=135651 RepID=G0MWD6_CAEBE|nr:hypothetical protein CAEBREN_03160 [Caenorhabditis brenneri]